MTVDAQNAIRFRPVKLGRDLGDKIEFSPASMRAIRSSPTPATNWARASKSKSKGSLRKTRLNNPAQNQPRKNHEKTNLSYSYRERRFGCSASFFFEAKISSLAWGSGH
jgi:hypothetical protein